MSTPSENFLRWSDIDWERETMRTFRHKTQAGFVVPLYPQLKSLLERRKTKALAQNGIVFRVRSTKKAITSACRRLGLPNYRGGLFDPPDPNGYMRVKSCPTQPDFCFRYV